MNCEHCRYTLCECGKAIWICNKVEDWWETSHRLHLVPGWNHFVSAGHTAIPKRWVGSHSSSLGEYILGLRVFG